MQPFQERRRVVMTRCHEDESCCKVLNFLDILYDKIGYANEETVAEIKPLEELCNKNLSRIFSEKSAD